MLNIIKNIANRQNYGEKRNQNIEWIVMHCTNNDGDTAKNNSIYFSRENPRHVSSHYFVDDNDIYQSVLDNYIAYHCGAKEYKHDFCRNENSIGIEMCDNKKDGKIEPSEKMLNNAARLVKELCKKYNIPYTNIIRHYDVTGKICPVYWVENDGLQQFIERVKAI